MPENDTKSQYKSVVAENKYLKDMVGVLEASLKTAVDENAKLEGRNTQLCMGIMPDILTHEFKCIMSSFGYHANTSCKAFRSKDEYDKLRADIDQLGREIKATETCLNDDFQGSPELPPRRPSAVRSYAEIFDHDDSSTDEESEDSSSQDESSDAQSDKRHKF